MSFTLDNGLRVVTHRDTATAMVAVDVLYNVGSRDESPEMTGIAHLFEHLMFGGSVNVPDFDGTLQQAGGVSNAWTSADFTNFYCVVPAVNVETAFRLEADRMLSLAFSDRALEVQRQVVVEEFKQVCLNRPYGDLEHRLRSLAFRKHPYRTPVIGKEFAHIEKVTQDDVRRWFAAHYAPNNAVLSVSGNIEAERVRQLAEKWFGDIPRRDIAPRLYPDEPLPRQARRVTVEGDVPQTALVMAFPMAAYGQPGYAEADVLTDVLANGKGSRMYRELLLGTDLFASVDASIWGTEHPGLLTVNAYLRSNGAETESRAIEAISRQLEALRTETVSPRELQRCVNRVDSDLTFGRLSYTAMGQALAAAEMHSEQLDDPFLRYRAVTPDTLRATAREILAPERCSTLVYRPKSAQ